MKKIGLICAMKSEVPKILKGSKKGKIRTFQIGDFVINTIVSGIGLDNAAKATEILCKNNNLDFIMGLGWCGGLKDYKLGQILLANSVCFYGTRINLQEQILEETMDLLDRKELDFKVGLFQTFNKVVKSKEETKSCSESIAVDMESYGQAQVARYYDMPLVIARIVSDNPPDRNPAFYQYPRIFTKLGINLIKTKKQINDFARIYFRHR